MIQRPPQIGQILICDFEGLKEPEMVKRRPVIALTGIDSHGRGCQLVTIVPISTTPPEEVMPYHYFIRNLPIMQGYEKREAWVKCDMVYTMSFRRLNLPRAGKNEGGRRNYAYVRISSDDLEHIRECVRQALYL